MSNFVYICSNKHYMIQNLIIWTYLYAYIIIYNHTTEVQNQDFSAYFYQIPYLVYTLPCIAS